MDEGVEGADAGEFEGGGKFSGEEQFGAEALGEEVEIEWADRLGIVRREGVEIGIEATGEVFSFFREGREVDEKSLHGGNDGLEWSGFKCGGGCGMRLSSEGGGVRVVGSEFTEEQSSGIARGFVRGVCGGGFSDGGWG